MDKCENTPVQGSKAPFDPGWNDPPQFSYNAQQTTPNRPRNFLNKRVAFPLSGTGSVPVPSPPVNLPPMPVPTAPAVPILNTPLSSTHEHVDITLDSESTLQEVKDILLQFVDGGELGSKGNDVKKRINIMEDMWLNGKLNTSIQVQMKELAYALRDDQPAKADEIHKSLMVDHVSAVCSWMSGVKQLIYHCKARLELLDIDKQETDKCDAE